MIDFAFIDSGIGGIPYMKSLLQRRPSASCVYIADAANFPYGEKTHEEVIECVNSLVEKICKKLSPSVIVIACNTMSVNALDSIRKSFPKVKFVGTVPAIKLASSISKKRRIGLLATKATSENPYNLELKNKFAADCSLINRADPELISYIEHNAFTASRTECLEAVRPAVDFFRREKCDVIILGCTHFLNFTEVFEEASGSDIKVVDSVDGVVRHAIEVLEEKTACETQGGVTGAAPVERVASKELRAQGETSPSLFVTGFADEKEKAQYDALCQRYDISFKGTF